MGDEIPAIELSRARHRRKRVALSCQSGSPTRQARGGPGVAEGERGSCQSGGVSLGLGPGQRVAPSADATSIRVGALLPCQPGIVIAHGPPIAAQCVAGAGPGYCASWPKNGSLGWGVFSNWCSIAENALLSRIHHTIGQRRRQLFSLCPSHANDVDDQDRKGQEDVGQGAPHRAARFWPQFSDRHLCDSLFRPFRACDLLGLLTQGGADAGEAPHPRCPGLGCCCPFGT